MLASPVSEIMRTDEAKTSKLDLKDIIRAAAIPKQDKDGWLVLAKRSESKETKEDAVVGLRVLRGLFKADLPYRTVIGLAFTLSTSAAGVLNTNITVAGVSSSGEWSSFGALFDEVFIHTMQVKFQPRNVLGAGVGSVTATTNTNIAINIAGGASNGQTINSGIVMVSLFNGAAQYSAGSNMPENRTHAIHHTGKPWIYTWRNNTRFDPRGTAISSSTTEAYQGWTLVSNIGNYGGSVQIRQLNDIAFGDAGHVVALGDYALLYELSFRARA